MPNHLRSINLLSDKYPTKEHYPFNLPIFSETKHLVFNNPVTMFVGNNGTGKSTLLEAIAVAGGIYIWRTGRNSRYEVNHYEASLHRYLQLNWSNGKVPGSFFGAQIFKDFASILDEWASTDPRQLELFGGKSLITQSHGQSLMSFFKSRYKLKGIYMLDEPETALSPSSQLELLKLLNENGKAG
ncbi:MAG: AAA family ATPase, partial [Mariniphaga sp.]|nr:AAA family ATPase [Mariniphaga sp.]